MKICIIGNYAGKLDEGMTNVSYYLYENLKILYPELLYRNVREIGTAGFWIGLIKEKPDIVHFIPGPTVKGLVLVKLLKLILRCKTVVSATKPVLPNAFRFVARMLRPDITVVQSSKSEKLFSKFGYHTSFIPNGVDTDRFRPIPSEKRKLLRTKHGFSEDDFIALHVGPLRTGRNQQSLLKLRDVKLLLIISLTNPSEEELVKTFNRPDVILWKEYFPNIEDIYAMVDVYIFPVFEPLNSIEIPLSVLEAMSCNIPVISSMYGALGRVLKEGDGLFFIQEPDKINEIVEKIREGLDNVDTRSKVSHLSWRQIAIEISAIYENLRDNNVQTNPSRMTFNRE